MDLISRQALCEYALNQKDKSITPNDIMRFPSAQQWIPCSERLPKKGNVVLITNEKGNVKHGQYRGVHYMASDGTCNWWWKGNRTEGVLAWMPLPQPWEGGQDDTGD